MTTPYSGYWGTTSTMRRRRADRDRVIARYWHHKLTGEICDGRLHCRCWPWHDEPRWVNTAHLKAPCSRYGDDGDECAWWAIALAFIRWDANGDAPTFDGLDYDMGLAVNDRDDVAETVWSHWYAVPPFVRDHIGTRNDVAALIYNFKRFREEET